MFTRVKSLTHIEPDRAAAAAVDVVVFVVVKIKKMILFTKEEAHIQDCS